MNKIIGINILYGSIEIERKNNSHKYSGVVCLKTGKKFSRTHRIKKIIDALNLDVYLIREEYYFPGGY